MNIEGQPKAKTGVSSSGSSTTSHFDKLSVTGVVIQSLSKYDM